MTKREQYRNVINMYFSTILGYTITKIHPSGFFYLDKNGEEKSVYSELGRGSLSTLSSIPHSYKGREVSVMVARSDFYVAIFPEMNIICIGRPKKLRLWLASSRSQWMLNEDEKGVSWISVKPKLLTEMFDKVQKLDNI